MMKGSDKVLVQDTVQACAAVGMRHVVIAPGSRNAPLIITFTQHPAFTCWPVPDERSAAFVALGMAQQLGEPVGVCCTSGSAVLNLAPALAEAYYQKVPLVAITADRPERFIDQGDGQTIRQQQIFANYIRASLHLGDEEYARVQHLPQLTTLLAQSQFPDGGPVHLNLAFEEPLYGQEAYDTLAMPEMAQEVATTPDLTALLADWQTAPRKLIFCGSLPPNPALQAELERLANDPSVVILTENLSNLAHPDFHGCVDRLIGSFSAADKEAFKPDLLLTIGDMVVSKMIKQWWRQHAPGRQYNITPGHLHYDMFGCLTDTLVASPLSVLQQLPVTNEPADFKRRWQEREQQTRTIHNTIIDSAQWTDLAVFRQVLEAVPSDSDLQLASSTPVRYAQLFDPRADIRYWSNRGVSGIDGSGSTAVGAAIATGRLTTYITGDIGFWYDSNALWNKHLPANLRIILINNGGGNIFRYIPGPDTTEALAEFFETHQCLTAGKLAETFGVDYRSVSDATQLAAGLHWLYGDGQGCSLLEIFTPREANALLLRQYFQQLKQIA